MPETRRPPLSRERVLDAALALVDRDGVARLSMRRLGNELGVEAMTLYHYVPNKDALLDGLVERVAREARRVPIGRPDPWPVWLRRFAEAFRVELLRHPALVPLVATRPVTTTAGLQEAERIAVALCDAGFGPLGAFHVLNTVTTFIVGHVLAEAGSTPGHPDADPDPDGLRASVDPEELPCFADAVRHGLGRPEDHEARFRFALDALIAGLAATTPASHA